MALDANEFLLSLAAAIADLAGLRLADTPRQLWAGASDQAQADDPWTTLRIYGGADRLSLRRFARLSIQSMTIGTSSQTTLAQAFATHESLVNEQGHPRHHWLIPGKRLDAASVVDDSLGDWDIAQVHLAQTPGIIGRDEQGKWNASFNFDVDLQPTGSRTWP